MVTGGEVLCMHEFLLAEGHTELSEPAELALQMVRAHEPMRDRDSKYKKRTRDGSVNRPGGG